MILYRYKHLKYNIMEELLKALIEARQLLRDNLKPDITDKKLHEKLKMINDTIEKYKSKA